MICECLFRTFRKDFWGIGGLLWGRGGWFKVKVKVKIKVTERAVAQRTDNLESDRNRGILSLREVWKGKRDIRE